ncbi:MAG: cholesterol oxidase [Bacteriovoracaceae bacterium]|jgi:cholesterol oxidase
MSDSENNNDGKNKELKRRSFIKATAAGIAGLGLGFGLGKRSGSKRKPSSIIGAASILGVDEVEGQISHNGTEKMDDYYDMIIIGSGYGSSVTAARMAESWKGTGKTIAVLERGKEYLPGDLPKKISDIRVRSKLDRDGLFDINLGITDKSDLDIIAASGLGGTSLINGAIAIEPEQKVQEHTDWPKEVRGKLAPYYKKARENLRSKKNDVGIMNTRKSQVHSKFMQARGVPFEIQTLNINYEDRVDSGIDRSACTMCGDCCSGCNIGAKNILPYNYLKQAKDHGANIFTYCEVQYFKKNGDEYIVHIVDISRFTVTERKIRTNNLVLGAGSMGSTALMLKSQKKDKRLKFSKTLGTRLSLNGDVLGFCYNGKHRTNAVGFGISPANRIFKDGDVGPMIASAGNYRDKFSETDFQQRFLLLESAIPSPVAGWAAHFLSKYAKATIPKDEFTTEQWDRVDRDRNKLFMNNEKHLTGDTNKDFGLFPATSRLSAEGALNYSTLFLACGHDAAAGKYVLDWTGKIQVVYKDVAEQTFNKIVVEEMKKVAEMMGGHFIPNPRTAMGGSGKMQATHPLGGCPMGEDHTSRTVNHKGQVFTENGDIYNGLYIVDASIIPRSLGATPLLTITALAERIHEFMKDDVA